MTFWSIKHKHEWSFVVNNMNCVFRAKKTQHIKTRITENQTVNTITSFGFRYPYAQPDSFICCVSLRPGAGVCDNAWGDCILLHLVNLPDPLNVLAFFFFFNKDNKLAGRGQFTLTVTTSLQTLLQVVANAVMSTLHFNPLPLNYQ